MAFGSSSPWPLREHPVGSERSVLRAFRRFRLRKPWSNHGELVQSIAKLMVFGVRGAVVQGEELKHVETPAVLK